MIEKPDKSLVLPRTTVEQWAVLAAVIDEGGYAQAAEALHRSQSAVSYALARLQEALGTPLLTLEGRRAVLTCSGETLLKRARRLVEELRALERLAASLKQGWEPELRLVVDAAFPRDRLLRSFAEIESACPQTQIQLAEAVLSGAEEAILQRQADVVITTRVPPGFLGDRLLDVEFVAVAHPDHPLAKLAAVSEQDLTQHTQVVVRDSGVRQPRDEGWLGAYRRLSVSSLEASFAVVRAGLAYAWLPTHVVCEALAQGALRALALTVGATRRMQLYLVIVDPALAGPAARAAAACFQRAAAA